MSEVLDKVGRYAESGQTRLYLQTLDLHDLDHLHLVAEEIKPHVWPAVDAVEPSNPSERTRPMSTGVTPGGPLSDRSLGHDVQASGPRFGRMLTAMATAFHDDGSVDLDGTARIAAHLVDHGHDGVVVSGHDRREPDHHRRRGRRDPARGHGRGRRPGDASSPASAPTPPPTPSSWPARPRSSAPTALLLVTPYYNKPGQAGVLHHFRAVVEATDVPVMLYDVPGRTGTQIALETYARRQGVGHRRRGQGRRRRLRPRRARSCELGYDLYSGDDVANLGWLAHGAPGVVSVVGHAAGDQIAAMIRRLPRRRPRRRPGDLPAAAARDRRHHGRPQLRRHHRQGRPPAARRPRQPQRPRPARAARRRRGRRAPRRAWSPPHLI